MVWHRDIWDHLSLSLTCLADGLCALQSPIVWQYRLLNCLRSAAERFLFPVLKRGTNYRKKSFLRHLLSTFQRHLKTFLFRKSFPDIIADWHFSGPCGNLNYLGHSKKFCLIDWLLDWSNHAVCCCKHQSRSEICWVDAVAVPRTLSSFGDCSFAATSPRACVEQATVTPPSSAVCWHF